MAVLSFRLPGLLLALGFGIVLGSELGSRTAGLPALSHGWLPVIVFLFLGGAVWVPVAGLFYVYNRLQSGAVARIDSFLLAFNGFGLGAVLLLLL